MWAIGSGNILGVIDDTDVEGMAVHFKTFGIFPAHSGEVHAVLIQSGHKGRIHFVPVAMTLMDAVLSIDRAEFSVRQLDIKTALA